MDIKIRIAEKEDLQQLAEVYNFTYKKFDIGEEWTVESSKKLLDYWFKRQPDLFFVAEDEDKIVGGFVTGVKPWWDGNHLVDGELFVHVDYQRKGIGTELFKIMYETALEKYSVTSFDTYTFKKTEFPLSWYKSQGFVENQDWIMIEGNVQKMFDKLKESN